MVLLVVAKKRPCFEVHLLGGYLVSIYSNSIITVKLALNLGCLKSVTIWKVLEFLNSFR